MARFWGRIEEGAVELRWTRRNEDGSDEQGRGRIRRLDDARLSVSLGNGESVSGAASFTAQSLAQ
jgi:hypothetical protein